MHAIKYKQCTIKNEFTAMNPSGLYHPHNNMTMVAICSQWLCGDNRLIYSLLCNDAIFYNILFQRNEETCGRG